MTSSSFFITLDKPMNIAFSVVYSNSYHMESHDLDKLKRGFSAFLIFLGFCLAVVGILFLFPVWKLLVFKPYIVDPEQMRFAAKYAVRFGFLSLIICLILIGFGVLIRKLKSSRFLSNFTVNLTLLILSAALFLFVGENMLRVLLPRGEHIFTYHPQNIWDLKADAEGKYRQTWVKINQQGFRGDPISLEPFEGKIRIAFIGNSVTFGYDTPLDQTFPILLKAFLNQNAIPPQYEIANLAVPGYDVPQELNKLKEYESCSFDHLLVGFCFNDVTSKFEFDPAFGGETVFERVPNQETPWQIRASLSLKNRYQLCYFGMKIIEVITSKISRRRGPARKGSIYTLGTDILTGKETEETRRAWEMTIAELDSLHFYAEDRNLPITLLIYPYKQMYTGVQNVQSANYPAKPLIDWVKSHNIAYLDFIQIFDKEAQATGGSPLDYFMDDNHPNRLGHRLIAESLFSYIKNQAEIR